MQYARLCGGWYAAWKDASGSWQLTHDRPYLLLCSLKRHYPYGYMR